MQFLLIKQRNTEPSLVQQLIIKKAAVSAIYAESDTVVEDPMLVNAGTLILSMNSGKEFRFKYKHYTTAAISAVALWQAVQSEKTVEFDI